MTTTTKQEVKLYFYNGFDKPKHLGNKLEDLFEVTITDNYLGDKSEELYEEVDFYCGGELMESDIEELKEILGYYDIFINPTLDELVEEAKRYFGNDVPSHHFTEFGSEYDVSNIVHRNYDDFKTYECYAGEFIVENYIRDSYFDTVVMSSESIDDCMNYLDDNDLWDDCILLGVNSKGRAFYPTF